jgi:uncharacterized protein (TIGR02246 family)
MTQFLHSRQLALILVAGLIIGVFAASRAETSTDAGKQDNGEAADRDEDVTRDQKATTDEEKPFRESAQAFVDAYAKRDAEAIGQLFTDEAEFYDEFRELTQGRDAIVRLFEGVFKSSPGAMIESIDIERVRYVTDTVVLEEGVVTATDVPGGEPFKSRYVALHVKENDGVWRINTLRDFPRESGGKNEHLRQLQWLIGEWVSEDESIAVETECRWSEDGNYLLRRFTVTVNGEKSLDGVQRVGWDPLRRQLRSWTFDSSGGFAEGYWTRNGKQWLLTSSGVTADGKPAGGTAVYSIVDAERVIWQYRNLLVGNQLREDLPPVTMVRRPPNPQAAAK